MPQYVYRCEECEHVFQAWHSIKGRLVDCDFCGAKESLVRIPSMPIVLNKNIGESKKEVGSVVKSHIEEAKKELKKEKENMKKQELE